MVVVKSKWWANGNNNNKEQAKEGNPLIRVLGNFHCHSLKNVPGVTFIAQFSFILFGEYVFVTRMVYLTREGKLQRTFSGGKLVEEKNVTYIHTTCASMCISPLKSMRGFESRVLQYNIITILNAHPGLVGII